MVSQNMNKNDKNLIGNHNNKPYGNLLSSRLTPNSNGIVSIPLSVLPVATDAIATPGSSQSHEYL